MKPVHIAVITFGDSEFQRGLESVLDDYDTTSVQFFPSLASPHFEVCKFAMILVNADRFHLKEEEAKNDFTGKIANWCKNTGMVVLMLTKNLSASEFLRHQAYHVTDTIDIGAGMDTLRLALDTFLTRMDDDRPSETDTARSGAL